MIILTPHLATFQCRLWEDTLTLNMELAAFYFHNYFLYLIKCYTNNKCLLIYPSGTGGELWYFALLESVISISWPFIPDRCACMANFDLVQPAEEYNKRQPWWELPFIATSLKGVLIRFCSSLVVLVALPPLIWTFQILRLLRLPYPSST
jgi:hypothetical protein